MQTFRSLLNSGKNILFDGATGTELQRRGLSPGQSPEQFCLENHSILSKLHQDYCLAGADVLTSNTFGGTRCKLPVSMDVYTFNKTMAEVAKRAAMKAGRPVFVAGSVGPSGQFLQPLGPYTFEDLVDVFAEQIRGLAAGGVDLILAETHYDLAEARAVVVASRRVSDLPVLVSMTYEDGVCLTGSNVEVCTLTLCNMGIDAVGMNCSAGPFEMAATVKKLLELSPLPVFVQPNAGLPELHGDRTVFPLAAEEFSVLTATFAEQGVQLLGGCCGAGPEHIQALRTYLDRLAPVAKRPRRDGVCISSRSALVRLGYEQPFCLIGERINPTGKKLLSKALQAGELDLACQFAEKQIVAGATVIDVNVGAPLVDETIVLPKLVAQLANSIAAPLSIDSSSSEAVAQALAVYPASPLVNSISGESGRMDRLGPLCRDYGAPFILLPLHGGDLPEKAGERIAIVENLLRTMEQMKVPRFLAVVDILALSVASNNLSAKESLFFIKYCRDVLQLPTVCGLSNLSFGLPARDLLNAGFLLHAAGAGLCAAIANPETPRLREALSSLYLMQGYDDGAESYITKYANWTAGNGAETVEAPHGAQAREQEDVAAALGDAVLKGEKTKIQELVSIALAQGSDPFALVNDYLIPAITIVGERYERKEFFLPQLIRSAESMQAAFQIIQPLLVQDVRAEKRPVVVLATVEGDIHDIGKNIVALMLGNHGFDVIDLGKNVKAEQIVEAACAHEAKLIGLSALMTTTMVRMQDTVELVSSQDLPQKVMVGGAVVTDAFARSIGAYYSHDAVGAVRLAQQLVHSIPKSARIKRT